MSALVETAPAVAVPLSVASAALLGGAVAVSLGAERRLGERLRRRAMISKRKEAPRALDAGRIAMRDGSSWGSMELGASTSVNTSGPLPFVELKRGSDTAAVYLLGATVTSYKTNGTEWLAVRPDAKLDGSKPISGGLPFCFPQFGPGDIQQHGFARNLEWRLLEEPSDAGKCVLELRDSEATRAMWPHAFRCEYTVELQDDRLATTFKVENTSASDFSFQAALHSYYSTSNVGACKITSKFQGATKIDKTQDPPKLSKGEADTVVISKFTEEVYKEVLPGSVVVSDPGKGELEIVSGGGWRDVVIWNPFGDAGMGADGFVCVESAELASVPLPPKGVWDATMDLVPKLLKQ